jgi:hypothetical protein
LKILREIFHASNLRLFRHFGSTETHRVRNSDLKQSFPAAARRIISFA